jgi:inner membrane protein
MASAFSHAFVVIALGKVSPDFVLTWRTVLLGVVCSIIPDIDVIGFYYGIQYGDLWGHRGVTHSVLFAAVLSGALVALWYRGRPMRERAWLSVYLFLCTASHGVLDAVTNGGLGVAFFSPFDTTRYFFPIRPVLVSPIGVGEFFSPYGMQVLTSEFVWIGVPVCAAVAVLRAVRRLWPAPGVTSSLPPL